MEINEIKEKLEKLDKNKLLNVTISQFNKKFELQKEIISKSADIQSNNWIIEKIVMAKPIAIVRTSVV